MKKLGARVKSKLGYVRGDADIEGTRKLLQQVKRDVEELGAGIAEQLRMLREYFDNAERLARVMASYYGGEFDRSEAWGDETLPSRPALDTALERWEYLNKVCRRSAASVIVEHALDPLRGLSDDLRGVQKALDAHDLALASKEPVDALRDDVFAKAEAAFGLHDRVVLDAACALAACHAELVGATADYLDEAADLLPQGGAKFKQQMAHLVKIGGPALPRKHRTRTKKVLAVATGKATFEDLKRQSRDLNQRRRLQVSQFKKTFEEGAGSRLVVALFDCAADNPDEDLAFRKGDVITLLDESDPDWWQGELRGHVGIFPSNYVAAHEDAPSSQRSGDYFVALYDCAIDDPNSRSEELAFATGDEIRVLEQREDGWWLATRLVDGETGLVPANYLRPK